MDLVSVLLWIVSTVSLAWFVKWLIWRLPRQLPPGPFGLPVLGYLPFISFTMYKDFLRLREKYGNVFGLYLGTQYAVVLNNFADIKEAYNNEDFLDKPPNWFSISKQADNIFDMGGRRWRETRRFTLTALRNLGMGKERSEELIKEEVSIFIEKLKNTDPGAEINVFNESYVHYLNIILIMICGRPYQDGDRLLDITEDYVEDFLQHLIDNQQNIFYPYLKPLMWLKRFVPACRRHAYEEMKDFIRTEIKKHENGLDENNLDDYLSYYLNEIKNMKNKKYSITNEVIMGNTEFLLFAGTDPARTTMSWTMLFLARYQEYQENVYQQIVNVVGNERPPQWTDKDNLSLVNAFIMEVSRYKTVLPAEDPRWSSKEAKIGTYCIPKNTLLVANLEAVHKDTKLWGDPQNFRPWRFINADGNVVTPEYLIPFLIGKRRCPGEKLANMQMFLFVSTLLQNFKVLPPTSGLILDDKFHLIRYPAKPVVSFQRR